MEGLYLPGFLLYLKWYDYNQELGIQGALLELNDNAIAKETSAGCPWIFDVNIKQITLK